MNRIELWTGTVFVWWSGLVLTAIVLGVLTWVVMVAWSALIDFVIERCGGPALLKQMRWSMPAWIEWAADIARTQDVEKWPKGERKEPGWIHADDLRKFFANFDPDNKHNWRPETPAQPRTTP